MAQLVYMSLCSHEQLLRLQAVMSCRHDVARAGRLLTHECCCRQLSRPLQAVQHLLQHRGGTGPRTPGSGPWPQGGVCTRMPAHALLPASRVRTGEISNNDEPR
jgi:hypothetical protein